MSKTENCWPDRPTNAFSIALKLTSLINVHGAFPKIDRWSSGSQIRERTLEDLNVYLMVKRLRSVIALRYSWLLSKQPIESKNTRQIAKEN
ncbi:hypothetical protein [Microcystis aeruginosa]|uniref:Uncharacterized protein n=1 Tax=Microcystis aeruginosa NIES-298 TaxID=449468 RepID=A0A9P2YNG9_MICAE|nr:hypothetical protein [Microcystis aeruginosa]GBD55327.1 hypothetical protein BGM30_44200 [Microcystis aeruginosa NIES-298]